MKLLLHLIFGLILGVSLHAHAESRLYEINEYYVGFDASKLPEELNDVIAKEADKWNWGADGPLKVSKGVRKKVLEIYKVRDDEIVYVKSFDKEKSASYKVSDLEITAQVNRAAGLNLVYGIGLIVSGGSGLALIGEKNPFSDVGVMKDIEPQASRTTYVIDSDLKLLVDRPMEADKNAEDPILAGVFRFEIQHGKNKPVFVDSGEVKKSSDVASVWVRAGKIFNDGSTLIYLSSIDLCGKYILIKNGKASVLKFVCSDAAGC
ncbi:hypothetical protein [Bdellovibrio sp. HCB2-146]|uniref:hypothetical protein n=1 Tax=Bdellovibrio sp. HCB2-146 TaxID=3394362 RepID=UPI0039BD8821